MEVTLSQAFLCTLLPDPVPRKQAEEHLLSRSQKPGYGLEVLQLLADASQGEQIRQAAAVHFKNYVKLMWNPGADQEGPRIQEDEKNQIKELIVRLMLSSPPRIQSQLSEGLAIISSHDFPARWSGLLPELVGSLNSSPNYASINGILQTVNAIFKKFRYAYKSVELYTDLKYCLDGFAAPLLEIFLKTGQLIRSTQDPAVLRLLFECQRLCCRVFYSLNSQELPEFFENHMREWMDEFQYFLKYTNPALRENDPEKESVVDQVKTAVCENINLYMEKNEEEFKDFLQSFATDVWNLLTSISLHPVHDRLAMSAMKFLTTVSRSVHYTLFAAPETLRQICECIAIPNVRVRGEDEELFEMNPLEYIRRDIEGSDQDTRRRIACELVKGLMIRFRDQVNGLIAAYIQGLIAKYSANPVENWKDKDTAIYLVVALTQKHVQTELVNFEQFFTTQIVPELQTADANSQAMLQADALKFITTFRSTIPKPMALALLPLITKFLVSESNVVHSYAAGCVEQLLLVKDGRVPRISSADLAPVQDQLLLNLLEALKLSESQENPYVMKCIMRILSLAEMEPLKSLHYLDGLVGVLTSVCNNPTNPLFNHYIFESVAALVRKACQRDQGVVMAFEQKLFPVFEFILQKDVTEFQPYAFQLLAQLIESRPPPIPDTYTQVFRILLLPELWKKSANVPAIVRLQQAFLLKASHQIASGDDLKTLVTRVCDLVLRKSSEDHAMFIANTLVESLSQDVLMPYVPVLLTGIFKRLHNASIRTVKFLKLLVIFMSLFVVKQGQATLVNSINVLSPNEPALFNTVLRLFWIPTLSSISGSVEVKLCAVASTRLLCECSALLAGGAEADQLWGSLLNSILVLLVKPEEERIENNDDDVPEIDQVSSYSGVYARLHNAGKKEDDPVKEIRDPKEYLCRALSTLSRSFPGGRFPSIIQQYVEAGNKDALLHLCLAYGTPIN